MLKLISNSDGIEKEESFDKKVAKGAALGAHAVPIKKAPSILQKAMKGADVTLDDIGTFFNSDGSWKMPIAEDENMDDTQTEDQVEIEIGTKGGNTQSSDVLKKSIGVEAIDAVSGKLVIKKILKKNSKLGMSNKMRFFPAYDSQTELDIRIFEGEDADPALCACLGIARARLTDPLPNRQAKKKIEITLTSTKDGKINVHGKDLFSNKDAFQRINLETTNTSEPDIIPSPTFSLREHIIKLFIALKSFFQKKSRLLILAGIVILFIFIGMIYQFQNQNEIDGIPIKPGDKFKVTLIDGQTYTVKVLSYKDNILQVKDIYTGNELKFKRNKIKELTEQEDHISVRFKNIRDGDIITIKPKDKQKRAAYGTVVSNSEGKIIIKENSNKEYVFPYDEIDKVYDE